MKKLLGVIGIVALAISMYFSTNLKISNFDTTLNDLLSTNEANAESFPYPDCKICSYSVYFYCYFQHYQTGERVNCPNSMYYG